MTVEERLVSVTNRFASLTSVIRSRAVEAERMKYHTGNESVEALVRRLEKVAKRLEDAVA